MNGCTAKILRDDYDSPYCAMRHVKGVTVMDVERGNWPEPPRGHPPVVLVKRHVMGRLTVSAAPAVRNEDGEWVVDPSGMWSAGGAYISGDSRVTEAQGFYGAVALHDYDLLCEKSRTPRETWKG